MKKVLLVARTAKFFSDFEINDIKILQSLGCEVWCAGNYAQDMHKLDALGVHKEHFAFASSPVDAGNVREYKKLCALMERERFSLVHCHTPLGAVYGRMAAHKTNTGPVLYTAHGFHFFTGGPKKNWIYYPVERFFSRWTDLLITINREDHDRAEQHFSMKRLLYLPGVGVDTARFREASGDRTALCEKLGIPKDAELLLSVGERNANKNHAAVIRTLTALPETVHFIHCGIGAINEDRIEELNALTAELQLQDRVHFLGYCDNIPEILKSVDLFCHPSFREGLPVAVMEAAAAGLPLVCSDIRGSHELCDPAGGILYDVHQADGLKEALTTMLKRRKDWEAMGRYNQEKIKAYDISRVGEIMRGVYEELLS